MARNQEKVNSILNRWTTFKSDIRGGEYSDRPKRFYGQCQNLDTAEERRRTIIQEMSAKIDQIQDPNLGEHKLRQLNDEINFLLQRKENYEKQIVKLGGSDYSTVQVFDKDPGKTLRDANGYRYYGATRDLPGIRELFVPLSKKNKTLKPKICIENIDLAYFGINQDHIINSNVVDNDIESEVSEEEENILDLTLERKKQELLEKYA